MDFALLAFGLGAIALTLGVFIYLIVQKIFTTEKIQPFMYGLLALIISDIMIIFLMVLCIFKATGIA